MFLFKYTAFFTSLLVLLLVFSSFDSHAQIGCCQNPGSNCVPSKSNDGTGTPPQNSNQTECEEGQGSTEFIWFAGEICVSGNVCPGFIPTGCCVIAVNDCIDDQNMTECDGFGGMLEEDTACADIPECNVPPPDTGCCVVGDNDCVDDQLQLQCPVPPNAVWVEGVACSAVPQCNLPPPDTGCCVIEDNNCVNDSTEEECPIPPNADWVENTNCDFVPQCNIPPPGEGCCVVGDANCLNDQTEQECPVPPNVEWVEDAACSSVPQCDMPPPFVSNVPTISQWGMIAMAGLLGLFSLFIIMRRKKYSLN
jgi:hypothetical protein